MANRRTTTRGHDLLGKVGRVLAWPWMKSMEPWIRVRSTTVDEDDEEATMMLKEMIGSRGSIEVQLGAFIVVFVASGLVPLEDALFVMFVTIYIFLLSCRCAFPAYPMTHVTLQKSHETRKGTWRQAYIVVGTLLSFFLPLAFALGGFSRGNPDPARAATPHLFLSASQLLSELVISQYPRFSPPVRVILTLLYTTRCVFSLTNWMLQAFSLHQYSQDALWVLFGRCLVVANFIHCNINIFCILIPRLLLRAFEKYIVAKNAYFASKHGQSNQSSMLTNNGVPKDTAKEIQNAILDGDVNIKGELERQGERNPRWKR